ncbi:DUF1460 domain-containing protein [Patescibacteria group bacterium]|nr:DUF1460 domain-containing protein [Patescibacteria group bacterium]
MSKNVLISFIALAVLIASAGIYLFTGKTQKSVICTQEAKVCPDGSTVSRVAPECEFAACAPKEDTLVDFGKWDDKSLNDFIESSKGDKNIGDRIEHISLGFIGTPYQGNTLIGSKDVPEKLVISLGGVDCSTMADYVLAMVFADSAEDFPWKLKDVRYESGQIAFTKRNHFFSQWIKNNSNYLSDISDSFAGSICATKELNRKKEGGYWIDGIQPFNQNICYVPRNASFESKLKSGDIIGFHTSSIGLDVTHMGIISIKDNETYLIHASSKYNKVIEEKLSEYLKRNPWSDGLIIARSLI